ncbi:MAG: GNAT family acetyltransferase [Acidobacteriota bacterium]|jgi:ribosomal protein S18 acetylase RimI-like enzyme
MNIRPFNKSDTDDVVGLWKECGLVVPWNDPIRDIERKMRVNPEWFLVGELNGHIIATCMVGYEGHRGWINYLAVKPDMQKQGLGRRMMERAEALMHDVGCAKINLMVRSSNRDVIRFYERIGYKQDAVVSMGKRIEPDIEAY